MKKRKAVSKVLSLILMFCMIITLLPAYVSADSGTGDTEMAKTEGNVQKVLDYAAQMRDKNQKENLSQGPFSWGYGEKGGYLALFQRADDGCFFDDRG